MSEAVSHCMEYLSFISHIFLQQSKNRKSYAQNGVSH